MHSTLNNALIFGANGQDGYYLGLACKAKGITPLAVSRSGDFIHGDVSCYDFVENLIKTYRPTYIFHMAANSTTSHEALFENHQTISTGTLNILEAAKKHSFASKIFITGSGVQFINTGKPVSENDDFQASNPYAAARIQSVYAGRYFRSLGLPVYIGYLFHHESPLRKKHHVSQIIACTAQHIARGEAKIIELGDISVEKEWTFAGDVAEGIFTLVEQNNVFEAVIGSGVAYSIENWLDECFGIIGKDWFNYVRLQKDFVPEYKRLVSNPKLIKSLGWHPTVGLPQLAAMMVNSNA